MPLRRCEAIVLKSYKLGEFDKIVTFLSREEGKLRGVAKGARKLKQRFGAAFEPLSHVRIEYFEKPGSDLLRIDSAELLRSFLQMDLGADALATLSCMSELLDEFAPERQANAAMFRLALAAAGAAIEANPRVVLTYFEVWMLRLAGLLPSFRDCVACRREVDEDEDLHASPEINGLRCKNCTPRGAMVLPAGARWLALAAQQMHPLEIAAAATDTRASTTLHAYLRQAIEQALGRRVRSYALIGN